MNKACCNSQRQLRQDAHLGAVGAAADLEANQSGAQAGEAGQGTQGGIQGATGYGGVADQSVGVNLGGSTEFQAQPGQALASIAPRIRRSIGA